MQNTRDATGPRADALHGDARRSSRRHWLSEASGLVVGDAGVGSGAARAALRGRASRLDDQGGADRS